MTYEATEKILFAADGFGKFGALDVEEEWANEAAATISVLSENMVPRYRRF